jgi:hypothetical protein
MTKPFALRALTLLATLALAPAALAAGETPTTGTPYVFVTVDDYTIESAYAVDITGILQGESTPRTLRFTFYSSVVDYSQHQSRCDRMVLLAMTRPGRYLLQMTQGAEDSSGTNARCKLTRK